MKLSNYSTKTFESKYTYTGHDLGASWTPGATAFRVWAPGAQSVKLRLYASGNHGAKDLLRQIDMESDVRGTWALSVEGDLQGVYYTYLVEREGVVKEACDPYARTTGVNGRRAMVVDLAATNPAGWERDKNPQGGKSVVDAVIYELHLRDLSVDAQSGIRHKGKYLGLAESGTKNPAGEPTGLDHIKDLGVTHVQLLPVYDYGSVDEAGDPEQYNWGYDPVNYNVPEGSYATDAADGTVRIRELKTMIKALHDNGIGVVMDVVYNHVYDRDRFCFNRIVPGYFSRRDSHGKWSEGSGCGNDTASERSMVRKYIIDSVKYWADEYHMDGFRFDLVGLIDVDTINAVMAEVKKDHPDVLFYGEGWTMHTGLTKPDVMLTTQRNAALVPGFGFFNDTTRDLLKGSVFDADVPGYVSGAQGQEAWIRDAFRAHIDWCDGPERTVNYVSCHDNMALYDRLMLSAPYADDEELLRMNCLAAAFCLTAQGVPLFQAGEELLRSKPLPDGTFDENSYRSPDSVNSIKWGCLAKPAYRRVRDYYKGLIALRKTYSALRLKTAREVLEHVLPMEGMKPNVTAFRIRCREEDPAESLFVIFNPNRLETMVPLPTGEWEILVRDTTAGTEALAKAKGRVEIGAISAMVLAQKKAPKEATK